jgi:hypothetical protein
MKFYKFIFLFILRAFKKNVIKEFKTIEKIDNNTFYLNDQNKSIQSVFRLLGKDTTFISNYDFKKIYKYLSLFLKENDEISFLKMDGNIEIDKSIDFLESLKNLEYPKSINDEIENNLELLNKLNEKSENSIQAKYFLVINNTKHDEYFKINEIKQNLNLCGLNIVEPNSKEIEELEKNIYFNNSHIQEK